MKDIDIILKSTSYPELTELRESDPEKYQELSQKVVETRFAELLPIFKRWQKNRISMTMYEISLRSIESQLDGLDYSLYDASIDSKRRLTQEFYEKCMCYSVDKIIEAASKRSNGYLKIIKNLINRCVKSLFNDRVQAMHRLNSILGYTPQQIDNLSLMSFLPFGNPTIGVEWILMGDMGKIEDMVDDWSLLLCLDDKMFSSGDFMNNLKNHLGVSTFIAVTTGLIQRITDKNSSAKVFFSLRKRFAKQIRKSIDNASTPTVGLEPRVSAAPLSEPIVSVTPRLKGYSLKTGIPFSSLVFGDGYMCYGTYIYWHPIFSRLPMGNYSANI